MGPTPSGHLDRAHEVGCNTPHCANGKSAGFRQDMRREVPAMLDGAHKYGMTKELEIDRDGLMHAPMAPGVGGEIDFGLIERKTEAVLR